MTNYGWVAWILGGLAGLGGLSGLGALLAAFFGRGKTRAEASAVVTQSAVSIINELQEDAKAARDELREVRTEAAMLAAELRQLRVAIFSPYATIDGLRLLAGGGPPNGDEPPTVAGRR
jgi:hypothetical protein